MSQLHCENSRQSNGDSQEKIKGTTYVYYENGRRYDSAIKYNVPQCTTIGKLSDMDPSMMIPNMNYRKFFRMLVCRTSFLNRSEAPA